MASSQGRIELGGFVDGSLRRRGQLLVVVGALLGAAGKDGDKPDKAKLEGRGQDKAGKDERKDKKSERD